ncbi:hypothetical protein [uncultured Ferrimonas sp.]|uniref:GapS1 family protein n=1 Tax=uncultured Ferrimonas sp. TaxID=432640 RepID=UPI00260831D3|nr:hypothetical protein [uncultured Ferrimonas sp.]
MSYQTRAASIIDDLGRYTDISFVNAAFNYLSSKTEHPASSMPWVILLALKWKFTSQKKQSQTEITTDEFRRIINKIWNLQSHALKLNRGDDALFSIKPFLRQQLSYQQTKEMYLSQLCRQHIWFNDNEILNEKFTSISGVSIDDYIKISFLLIIWINQNEQKESSHVSIGDILIRLSPHYCNDKISSYLKFIGMPLEGCEDFFERYKQAHHPRWEYFEDSPLALKPFIYSNHHAITFSRNVFSLGVANLLVNTLKYEMNEDFKTEFGSALEVYVDNLFNIHNLSYIIEKDIINKYRSNSTSGKVVDFIINEPNGHVFIDSKAIEPTILIKTTDNKKDVEDRLKGSFIKGIIQAQECASKMSELVTLNANIYSIIVTHQNFMICTARDLDGSINSDLENLILDETCHMPISLDRVFYASISELEHLLDIAKATNKSISEILDEVSTMSKDKFGSRGDLSSYLVELYPNKKSPQLTPINSVSDVIFDEIKLQFKQSEKLWNGQVYEFLSLYSDVHKAIQHECHP